MADSNARPLAVVTGASSGIGLELARQFAGNDFDLIVAADDAAITDAATELRATGASVETVRADLATKDGVDCVVEQVVADGRPLAAIAINAGVGVSGPFVETELQDHIDLIDLNVTGSVRLAREVLPAMVANGEGRVLFTSSVAATMPGPYMSTYNASKSFLYSFSLALREEVKDSGVTVTALMPGPTDTEFFERADMEDTKLGQSKKDDPADVARDGFEAMMAGKDHVVAGSKKNKAQVVAATVLPDKAVAATHAKLSEPGSGE
jgi:short-subunit dehydrogenase